MTAQKAPQEENPSPTQFAMPHCGEFLLKDGTINGWFQPIPIYQWREIIGFHKTLSIATNAETVSYHKWDPARKRYHTIIPFQDTVPGGLSVDVDWEDHRNIKLLDDFAKANGGDSMLPACTIHTHVNSSAFESGTDAADEDDMPGWHLTLGHLSKHKTLLDVHSRFRLPKVKRVIKHTTVKEGYEFPLANLFPAGTDMELVLNCPWTNQNLLQFADRVALTKKTIYRGYSSQTYK